MFLGCAQAGARDGQRRRPRKPPQEALDACDGASQGDACSFEGRDGEQLSGTCEAPPDDTSKPLACRPSQPPRDEDGDRPERPQSGGSV